jgi:DNA-binding NarL/FixJ family response regulator
MTGVHDKISILLVDDSENKLISLEAVLGDLDLDIVRANSGREALRRLLSQDFAAILLDVNMPGIDGFETASLIRQRKKSESTPILFITAYGDEPYVSRGYALGAVDYILTPVIPDVLRTKVGVFVELFRKSLEIQRQADKLAHRANQLAALAAELTYAEQRERRRLAQVLHDDLQQLLVASRMRLGALGRGTSKADRQVVGQIDDLLNQAIESSRSLTSQLSPPILYDAGLVPALEWLARQMNDNHALCVEIETHGITDFATEALRAFMFQAVRELLFNCVKHAGVKTARVVIGRSCDEYIKVAVQDSGKGFNPEAVDSPNGTMDHFGLLSIRERVRLLNGQFNVQSSPGNGTIVSVELPARIEGPNHKATPLQQTLTPPLAPSDFVDASVFHRAGSGDSKIRVLLADDHEVMRKGLAMLLAKQADIEVVGEAIDGPTAIELARRIPADVIVMDVSMPELNGIEATKRIKQDNPDVRVIGLSMHEREDMEAAMHLAGAEAYLSKGGPPDALIAAIRGSATLKPPASPTSPRASA